MTTDDIAELSDADFESAIPSRLRKRLIQGKFEAGEDIAALRRFVRLTQAQFAQAMGLSVHTLRNGNRDVAPQRVQLWPSCQSRPNIHASSARILSPRHDTLSRSTAALHLSRGLI